MKWQSGQPIDIGYYLCAIVGNSTPRELYWDGLGWYDVDNNGVLYYMNLSDIPMPEGW